MLTAQEKKTNQQIIAKLKQARLDNNLTQAQLAKKAGINSNYYSKVERGEAISSILTLKKILGALGIKSSDVLTF
jgi:transcriptional regulator with XRE-family HTH domain